MKFRVILSIFCLLATSVFRVSSQTFLEQHQQYHIISNGNDKIINGFQSFATSDERIFSNAMVWVVNNLCNSGLDAFKEVDVQKKSFICRLVYNIDKKKSKNIYYAKMAIKVADGKVVYQVHDILYKSSGILANEAPIERLNPEKKESHKQMIDEFEKYASGTLNALFDAVVENTCQPVNAWSDIAIQRPVKGMNETECLMAFGKPSNVFDSGNGIQWTFKTGLLLFFDNKTHTVNTIVR